MLATTGIRLIMMKKLLERVPYSKVHIYRLMEQGKFPRAVPVGAQRVAWVETEIDDWIAKRLISRDLTNPDEEAVSRKALAHLAVRTRHNQAKKSAL